MGLIFVRTLFATWSLALSNCLAVSVTMAFMRGDELYIANVGDCRAVLGRQRGHGFEAIDLTIDHKPDRPDERERIIKHGGRVEPVRLQASDNFVGPMRIWKQNSNVPGLAVSRSVGAALGSVVKCLTRRSLTDVCMPDPGDIIGHNIGIVAQPECTHTKLDEKDMFLILATDGVWEWMSSQEAVDCVGKDDDAEAACERLTREAYARWEKEGDGIADDTTAIVIFFNHGGVARTVPGAEEGYED
jgi:serine/threonine protein phosphatase PrpC